MSAEDEGAEVTPADDAAEGDRDIDASDAFKRRVAVVLALLGVLGAWVGILHNDSGNSEATFARETTRTAVGSLRANVNQSTVEGLGADLDAEEAALGLAGPFRPDAPGGSGDVTTAEREAAAVAGLDPDARETLERRLTVEAEALDLKRQALAETRVTYNNRTSQYETVLTTLAVALFLVGFTLVLNRRTRPPVLVPGLLLAAYVAGWAIWIHQREVPTTSDAAIEAAAEAGMHQSFGEFDEALTLYTEAIDADGDFQAAYAGRSIAGFLGVNPDFTRTLSVIDTGSEQAQQAYEDADEAIRLSENSEFTSLLVAGIYDFYASDFDGAVERFEEAVTVSAEAPEGFLLLSSARLAQGDEKGADEALADAVSLLSLDEESDANRQFAADFLTLLGEVEAGAPERAAAVAELRADLAAGEARLVFGATDLGEPAPDAVFSLDRSDLQGATLDASLSYEDLPADSRVSVYIYEQPVDGVPFAQASELALFATVDGSGALEGAVDLERSCLPVAFRYDVYVNGVLADSFDAPGGQPTC